MKKTLSYLFAIMNLYHSIVIAQALPPGSYQQSCENIELIGTTLRAMCEGAPPYVMTSLDNATTCSAPIENIQGNLVCPTQRMPNAVIPDGPYSASCKNIQLIGGFYLDAICPNFAGNYLQSQLNLGQCQGVEFWGAQARGGFVINNNGQLSCN